MLCIIRTLATGCLALIYTEKHDFSTSWCLSVCVGFLFCVSVISGNSILNTCFDNELSLRKDDNHKRCTTQLAKFYSFNLLPHSFELRTIGGDLALYWLSQISLNYGYLFDEGKRAMPLDAVSHLSPYRQNTTNCVVCILGTRMALAVIFRTYL